MNSANNTEVFKPKTYKRKNGTNFDRVGTVSGDDLRDLLDMSISELKSNKRASYPNTPEGLENFKQRSTDYLEFIRDRNENGAGLTPTVESWAAFLGISRMSIIKYTRRDFSWFEFIEKFKNILMACKTELAARGKLPPIVYVFDATNNGAHYYNTSEFRLTSNPPEVVERQEYEDPAVIMERYRSRLADKQQNEPETVHLSDFSNVQNCVSEHEYLNNSSLFGSNEG